MILYVLSILRASVLNKILIDMTMVDSMVNEIPIGFYESCFHPWITLF